MAHLFAICSNSGKHDFVSVDSIPKSLESDEFNQFIHLTYDKLVRYIVCELMNSLQVSFNVWQNQEMEKKKRD